MTQDVNIQESVAQKHIFMQRSFMVQDELFDDDGSVCFTAWVDAEARDVAKPLRML